MTVNMRETASSRSHVIHDGGLVLKPKGFYFLEGVDNLGGRNIADRRYITLRSRKHYWVVCDYTAADGSASLSFIEVKKKKQLLWPGKTDSIELRVRLDTVSFGKDEETILSSIEEIRNSYMRLLHAGKTPSEILAVFAKPPETT